MKLWLTLHIQLYNYIKSSWILFSPFLSSIWILLVASHLNSSGRYLIQTIIFFYDKKINKIVLLFSRISLSGLTNWIFYLHKNTCLKLDLLTSSENLSKLNELSESLKLGFIISYYFIPGFFLSYYTLFMMCSFDVQSLI